NSMQVQRRISLQVPHFSVLPKIIPGTDLLAVLPAQIARLFVQEGGLKMLELPFQVAEFNVSLNWHPNSDNAAALQWFCTTVAEAIIDGQA
ncbi:LysR substrate-binding domain-containing protein, partial [Pseudomonas sp.]